MDLPSFDKFEVRSLITANDCIKVYDAIDHRSDGHVQLKVFDKTISENKSLSMEFLVTANVVKRLKHPNVGQVFDYGNDAQSGLMYLATERMELDRLDALILEQFSLSAEDLVDIFSAIGTALSHTHRRGLMHGLLNPHNVYIRTDGAIKIDDFGLSWCIPSLLQGSEESTLYMARYIAPEFHTAPGRVDGRSDVYSLGMMLYEILACKNPIQGKSMAEIYQQHVAGDFPAIDFSALQLPDGLRTILSKTLQASPDRRYQSMNECLAAFNILKASRPTPEISQGVPAQAVTDDENPINDEISIRSGGILSRKLVWSLSSAVLLVVLFLFVTNYIPSFSGGDDSLSSFEQLSSTEPILQEPKSESETVEETDVASTDYGNWGSDTELAETEVSEKQGEEYTFKTSDPAIHTTVPPNNDNNQTRSAEARNANANEGNFLDATRVLTPPIRRTNLTVFTFSGQKPISANVFLNNSLTGQTDSDGGIDLFDLEVGKTYSFKASKKGYASTSQRIKISPVQSPIKLDLKVKREVMSTLLVDAIPNADEIYVDGVLREGKTPMRLSLKGGNHQVRLVSKSHQSEWQKDVDLRVGQVMRIKHDFTKQEIGRVAVSLQNAAQFGFGYVHVDGKLWPEKHNTTPLELKLSVGLHLIELKRDGFVCEPPSIRVQVAKDETQYISFSLERAAGAN